ncbi:MAG: dockerin type I domain-containing protein [Chthoniobacterales bacterium]
MDIVLGIRGKVLATLGLAVLVSSPAFGLETTGAADPTFNSASFTNGQASVTLIQPDGKFLVAGSFAKANGVSRRNIVRFNPDGTLDAGFNPGTGTDFGITGMSLQPDNKILIYNGFSTVNGVPRFAGIARLNSDGSLETGFNPGNVISYDGLDDGMGNATSNGSVSAVVLQPDGKIVVFGYFYYIITGPGTSVPRSGVARFNSDGTFDASYNPGTGFTSTAGPGIAGASYVARQNVAPNDGKIVVSGAFDGYNGSPVPGLARLDVNGVLDPSFTPGTATPPELVGGIFVQADDQIVVYGGFTSFNGAARNAIVRLTTAGAVDPGFSTGLLKDYGDQGTINGVAQQADGKLVVVGYFHSLGGVSANNVARLETNGTRDATFGAIGAGPSSFNVTAVTVRASDQKILLGGWFPTYDGVLRNNIVLANTDGTADTVFAPSLGLTDNGPEIYAVVSQPDGKTILAGLFTSFNGVPLHNIVRLNPDGTRDTSFGITLGTTRSVRAMVVQPNGQIIIVGTFTAIDGVAQGRVARLNADGTVDPTFNPGTGPDNICYAVALDAAGNVYVGGSFKNVNGTPRAGVAKLSSTGALDMTFNPGSGFDGIVFAIAPPTGAAGPVIGGSFANYNGAPAGRIARLDATTGARDAGFSCSFNGTVRALFPVSGGGYLVGGSFSSYNNGAAVGRSRLARVLNSGALDTTFVGPTIGGTVRAFAVQGNGKVVAGGSFTGIGFAQIARFAATGTLDSTFSTGTGAISSPPTTFVLNNSSVDALAFQADGKLLATGIFNQYNGVPHFGAVRLGSNLAFSAVSRKTHGASGTFDIPLPVTGNVGVECRSGGPTNDHHIVFTLAGNVTYQDASVSPGTGSVTTISGNGTSTVQVDLTGVTNLQTLTVNLIGVSDGLNMANLSVPVGILLGDTNGNGSVTSTDIAQAKSQSGQAVGASNFRTDVNANGGTINSSDVAQVKSQSGNTLPTAPTAAQRR